MHVVCFSQPFLLFLRSFRCTPGKSSPHPPGTPTKIESQIFINMAKIPCPMLDSHSRRT